MKVGIDASRLRPGMTGIGRYVCNILAPLDAALPEASFVLYARSQCDVDLPSRRWSLQCDRHPLWSRLPISVWIHRRLGSLVRQDSPDVFWAANTLLPVGVGSLPCVSTVYDLNHVLFPQTMSALTRFAHWRWFTADVLRANRVVAISHGTSERLQGLLGRKADAIAFPAVPDRGSIPTHAQTVSCLTRLGVRQPFLLTVGTLEPRKNIGSAISAVALLRSRGKLGSHQLVMVGATGWGSNQTAAVYRGADWIKAIGYVDDPSLKALYMSADALLFPSLYEGYGIPVGEARTYGCRVVATDIPELREAGGQGVIYIGPSAEAIAEGIDAVLSMPKPLACNPDHDWRDTAAVMARMLSEAAATPS